MNFILMMLLFLSSVFSIEVAANENDKTLKIERLLDWNTHETTPECTNCKKTPPFHEWVIEWDKSLVNKIIIVPEKVVHDIIEDEEEVELPAIKKILVKDKKTGLEKWSYDYYIPEMLTKPVWNEICKEQFRNLQLMAVASESVPGSDGKLLPHKYFYQHLSLVLHMNLEKLEQEEPTCSPHLQIENLRRDNDGFMGLNYPNSQLP